MRMRWWLFRILTVCCLLLPCRLQAAGLSAERRYTHRMIPDNVSVQFAGSIGFLSLGTGWEYGNGHWETDVLFGLVPKVEGQSAMVSFTLKQEYVPWHISLGERRDFVLQPLQCGLFVNTLLNRNFWTIEPDRYPTGYYGFSTKVRFHAYLGQSITYNLPERCRFGNRVSFYYEIGSCDLYIINALKNRCLKPADFLSLALGLKWHF